jgi:hypothetical protein
LAGFAAFQRTALVDALGIASFRSSHCCVIRSVVIKLTPVRLPPGGARLAPRPVCRGSPPWAIPLGIVVVAC